MKKTRIGERWKIFEWKKGGPFYIGPLHGRFAVATYKTKIEAKVALEMYHWMLKQI